VEERTVAVPPALARALEGKRRLVVLTGAGMSAESGVPVFRGPGGLWEGFRPEDLATPEAFAHDATRVWRWYRWRLERVQAAQPHAGHEALVRLEREWPGRLRVVTQNVDGLHQSAGTTGVVELHGNLTRARCTAACGRRAASGDVDPERPECACGLGRLRPDVVWFGEGLDPVSVQEASQALLAADLVWVVGTSSLVYPAAALPELASRRGVPVVEVNPEPTPLSDDLPFTLRAPAGAGLAALARRLLDSRDGAGSGPPGSR
jgi:NAD-dependent deacetylase